jgi:hypothetical protein
MNDYLKTLPQGFDRYDMALYSRSEDNPMAARERMRKLYGFAIPTDAAIRMIADLGDEIVEIGAGSGYWAHLLSKAGASVRAYDNGSWSGFFNEKPWFDVRRGGPGMIRHFPSAVVLIVWPPYDDPMAFNVAKRIRIGQYFVFVGEGSGGCTGTDGFFDLLESDFERICGVSLPQWWGLHDYLTIYRREQ